MKCTFIIEFHSLNTELEFKLCHARLNATNALESTPLHTAACLPNFNKEIVELLLAEGSHMDMRNVQVGYCFKSGRLIKWYLILLFYRE